MEDKSKQRSVDEPRDATEITTSGFLKWVKENEAEINKHGRALLETGARITGEFAKNAPKQKD